MGKKSENVLFRHSRESRNPVPPKRDQIANHAKAWFWTPSRHSAGFTGVTTFYETIKTESMNYFHGKGIL